MNNAKNMKKYLSLLLVLLSALLLSGHAATVDNYVLPGSTPPPPSSTPPAPPSNLSASSESSYQVHHREHNLLLDATISGNMGSFNKGLRSHKNRSDIAAMNYRPHFLVYDFKNQDFNAIVRWMTFNEGKKLADPAEFYEYGVRIDADLGVVPLSNAAYWMAQWTAPVSANFIRIMGTNPNESSQANTAWRIELRSNNTWRVHAQGVGGWYDRGEYFWGGRGQSPIQFDALRVRVYSRDESSSLRNIHFRAQENRTWMVAFLPAIDARIAVTQKVPRAGQVVNFAGNQVFGAVQSWQWNFGDGRTATGRTVANTYANHGNWLTRVDNVTVGDRYTGYRLTQTTASTSTRSINSIDWAAMRDDCIETLNGKPTALPPTRQKR